jgi:hypothetical protein
LVLQKGVEHFVRFAGGSTSFYGVSPTETVAALLLRAVDDASGTLEYVFQPRPSVLTFLTAPTTTAPMIVEETLFDTMDNEQLSAMNVDGEQVVANEVVDDLHAPDEENENLEIPAVDSDRFDPATHRMRELIRSLNFQVFRTYFMCNRLKLSKLLDAGDCSSGKCISTARSSTTKISSGISRKSRAFLCS